MYIFILGQKPHECKKCGKRFALGCNMKAHMKTHENPASKFNTENNSPTVDSEDNTGIEDNEEDVGEEMSIGEHADMIN